MIFIICVVLILSVGALLWAEKTHLQTLIWIAKPLASTLFLLYALQLGALESDYGKLIFYGLCLSWLGDVLLIRSEKLFFLLGLVSFLVAHVCYLFAFFSISKGHFGLEFSGVVALTAVLGFFVKRWLIPHVKAKQPEMTLPVYAYMLVITVMVCMAGGASWSTKQWIYAAGALMFYFSDIAVAREQFVKKSFTNKLWGLPLYYLAQIVIASTISLVKGDL